MRSDADIWHHVGTAGDVKVLLISSKVASSKK